MAIEVSLEEMSTAKLRQNHVYLSAFAKSKTTDLRKSLVHEVGQPLFLKLLKPLAKNLLWNDSVTLSDSDKKFLRKNVSFLEELEAGNIKHLKPRDLAILPRVLGCALGHFDDVTIGGDA